MKAYVAVAALGVLAAVGVGSTLAPPVADYTSLDAKGEPLKTRFNRDAGKIRVLMLVAPT